MDIVITATQEQVDVFQASCLESKETWLQNAWDNKCRQKTDYFVEQSGQGSKHSTDEKKNAIIAGLNLQPRTK